MASPNASFPNFNLDHADFDMFDPNHLELSQPADTSTAGGVFMPSAELPLDTDDIYPVQGTVETDGMRATEALGDLAGGGGGSGGAPPTPSETPAAPSSIILPGVAAQSGRLIYDKLSEVLTALSLNDTEPAVSMADEIWWILYPLIYHFGMFHFHFTDTGTVGRLTRIAVPSNPHADYGFQCSTLPFRGHSADILSPYPFKGKISILLSFPVPCVTTITKIFGTENDEIEMNSTGIIDSKHSMSIVYAAALSIWSQVRHFRSHLFHMLYQLGCIVFYPIIPQPHGRTQSNANTNAYKSTRDRVNLSTMFRMKHLRSVWFASLGSCIALTSLGPTTPRGDAIEASWTTLESELQTAGRGIAMGMEGINSVQEKTAPISNLVIQLYTAMATENVLRLIQDEPPSRHNDLFIKHLMDHFNSAKKMYKDGNMPLHKAIIAHYLAETKHASCLHGITFNRRVEAVIGYSKTDKTLAYRSYLYDFSDLQYTPPEDDADIDITVKIDSARPNSLPKAYLKRTGLWHKSGTIIIKNAALHAAYETFFTNLIHTTGRTNYVITSSGTTAIPLLPGELSSLIIAGTAPQSSGITNTRHDPFLLYPDERHATFDYLLRYLWFALYPNLATEQGVTEDDIPTLIQQTATRLATTYPNMANIQTICTRVMTLEVLTPTDRIVTRKKTLEYLRHLMRLLNTIITRGISLNWHAIRGSDKAKNPAFWDDIIKDQIADIFNAIPKPTGDALKNAYLELLDILYNYDPSTKGSLKGYEKYPGFYSVPPGFGQDPNSTIGKATRNTAIGERGKPPMALELPEPISGLHDFSDDAPLPQHPSSLLISYQHSARLYYADGLNKSMFLFSGLGLHVDMSALFDELPPTIFDIPTNVFDISTLFTAKMELGTGPGGSATGSDTTLPVVKNGAQNRFFLLLGLLYYKTHAESKENAGGDKKIAPIYKLGDDADEWFVVCLRQMLYLGRFDGNVLMDLYYNANKDVRDQKLIDTVERLLAFLLFFGNARHPNIFNLTLVPDLIQFAIAWTQPSDSTRGPASSGLLEHLLNPETGILSFGMPEPRYVDIDGVRTDFSRSPMLPARWKSFDYTTGPTPHGASLHTKFQQRIDDILKPVWYHTPTERAEVAADIYDTTISDPERIAELPFPKFPWNLALQKCAEDLHLGSLLHVRIAADLAVQANAFTTSSSSSSSSLPTSNHIEAVRYKECGWRAFPGYQMDQSDAMDLEVIDQLPPSPSPDSPGGMDFGGDVGDVHHEQSRDDEIDFATAFPEPHLLLKAHLFRLVRNILPPTATNQQYVDAISPMLPRGTSLSQNSMFEIQQEAEKMDRADEAISSEATFFGPY